MSHAVVGGSLLAAAIRAAILAKAPRRTVQAVAASVTNVLVSSGVAAKSAGREAAGRRTSTGEVVDEASPQPNLSPEGLVGALQEARRARRRQKRKEKRKAAKDAAQSAELVGNLDIAPLGRGTPGGQCQNLDPQENAAEKIRMPSDIPDGEHEPQHKKQCVVIEQVQDAVVCDEGNSILGGALPDDQTSQDVQKIEELEVDMPLQLVQLPKLKSPSWGTVKLNDKAGDCLPWALGICQDCARNVWLSEEKDYALCVKGQMSRMFRDLLVKKSERAKEMREVFQMYKKQAKVNIADEEFADRLMEKGTPWGAFEIYFYAMRCGKQVLVHQPGQEPILFGREKVGTFDSPYHLWYQAGHYSAIINVARGKRFSWQRPGKDLMMGIN